MIYELLLKNIAKYIHLAKDKEDHFISLLRHKKIKRKHFFLQEGEINKSVAFVNAGCLRSYSIDKNGFEHILQFAPPGWWITDMYSLTTQKPGTLNIDAVDDSEIILLLKSDLDKLYFSIPKFERFFRILAENSLATPDNCTIIIK
ncbi:MAG: Crp/Fnr family transcriptional regulator [Chitinophagaceae bacterium]